jgi:hypothetical protein
MNTWDAVRLHAQAAVGFDHLADEAVGARLT